MHGVLQTHVGENSQVQGCLLLSVAWESEATVAVKGSVLHLRDYFSSYFP